MDVNVDEIFSKALILLSSDSKHEPVSTFQNSQKVNKSVQITV